ncbi:hypothetical protein J7K18_02965 [bacterium]|nr:hypothetical protein [bacterium]
MFGDGRHSEVLCTLPLFGSLNTGYTVHFVRPNRLTPTSYSPIPLFAMCIMMKEM